MSFELIIALIWAVSIIICIIYIPWKTLSKERICSRIFTDGVKMIVFAPWYAMCFLFLWLLDFCEWIENHTKGRR